MIIALFNTQGIGKERPQLKKGEAFFINPDNIIRLEPKKHQTGSINTAVHMVGGEQFLMHQDPFQLAKQINSATDRVRRDPRRV